MGSKIKNLDLRPSNAKKALSVSKRSAFNAAKISRLSSSWTTIPRNTDSEIRESLLTLRARSRNLGYNNDYGKRFLNLVKTNLIGHGGIKLQSRVVDKDGDLDEKTNTLIEDSYKRWGKKGNCTKNKKQSLLSFLSLLAVSLPTDGEILIRKVKGRNVNRHGFALHQYDPDYLDVDLNVELSNGNEIRMGVEVDKWGAPVNYHFLTYHPNDWTYNRRNNPKKYEIVPASEMIHFYLHERVNQTRGIPWMATPAERLYQLGGYEEAELIAARAGATKMGFYKTPTGAEYDGAGDLDVDADGEYTLEDLDKKRDAPEMAEPGTFEELPEGWEFIPYDPQHPNSSFDAFRKSILYGVSAGLNVSFVSLTGDLSGVSYSSIRQNTLSDQDTWRMLQNLFISEVIEDFYPELLYCSLLNHEISLDISEFDSLNSATWQPRGWEWVDPLKEELANEKAIANLTRTPQDIVGSRGGDIYENIEAIKRAKAAADKAELKSKALHWYEILELKQKKSEGKPQDGN
jgi:lambda family phage portal protein